MSGRKQALLKHHRRNKRIGLLLVLACLIGVGVLLPWWCLLVAVALVWVVHEAWLADHLFYSPAQDYQYDFPAESRKFPVRLHNGSIEGDLAAAFDGTLILELELRCNWLGRLFDPYVRVGDDRQDFERGVSGRRYLNLSGQFEALCGGELRVVSRFCRLPHTAVLHILPTQDYGRRRLMIVAPHADDAELAAYGVYSRSEEVVIVTLTQGEIEAEAYLRLGLSGEQAARLKGRLRTWDSRAIPLWGGVAPDRCFQLGYYCLRLAEMAEVPGQGFSSRESGETDIRSARTSNSLRLPGDRDGVPCWDNLVADLSTLIEHWQPEVIVTPHPQLDPHSDHVAATRAVHQALASVSGWQGTLLLYANHLHDNDRWPMGPAGFGVALPPVTEALPADSLWSPALDAQVRLDKAMALAMQHDLQGGMPLKKWLRRQIQKVLTGRRWPATGDNEFFRKAVRRHELFWVRAYSDRNSVDDE